MFTFTTLTLFNNIVKSEITAKGLHPTKGSNLIVSTVEDKLGNVINPYVRIGNTRFSPEQIESISVKAPTQEVLASVTFDMSDITFEDDEKIAIARIVLYIGLSMNSLESVYANPFIYKGKPFYVEFKAFKGNAEKTAKECKRVVEKFLLFETDEKLLDVTVNGTKVTISGTNGYQLIRKAVLLLYDADAITVDCCTSEGDFVTIKTGVPVAYTVSGNVATAIKTDDKEQKVGESGLEDLSDDEVAILPGLEAFCDYNWIIHNLRLPTTGNTSYFGPNKEEMPVVGQSYTQFTITMKDTRDRVAGEGVGMRITSVTTHVLYVAGNYTSNGTPAKEVYGALTTLVTGTNVTIDTSADTKLNAPYSELTD